MKPRDEKKIERIYEVTPKIVVKYGMSGFTMMHIAKEAKIAIGTLYIYFKNKNELISAVYERCRDESLENYFQGYNEKDAYKKGFKKVWLNILSYRLNSFEKALFVEQCYYSEYIEGGLKQLHTNHIQPLIKLIERGKRENIVKKNADTLLLLVFMFGGIGQLAKYTYTQKIPVKDVLDVSFELCWSALTA